MQNDVFRAQDLPRRQCDDKYEYNRHFSLRRLSSNDLKQSILDNIAAEDTVKGPNDKNNEYIRKILKGTHSMNDAKEIISKE